MVKSVLLIIEYCSAVRVCGLCAVQIAEAVTRRRYD
jgi:hypothetical protein